MTRGRKPKPTAAKKLRGNPGKRPMNTAEPASLEGIPPAPPDLSEVARAEWVRVTTELAEMRLIGREMRIPLVAYCETYAILHQAREEMAKSPGLLITTDKGNILQNPLVPILRGAAMALLKFSAEFGITPSARTRVTAIGSATDEDDEFDQLRLRIAGKVG